MDLLTAVLTVCQRARPGICVFAKNYFTAQKSPSIESFSLSELTAGQVLTDAGSVRRHRVAIEAVTLVAPIAVHAAVFTGTRFQPAFVQVCRKRFCFAQSQP